MTQDNTQQQPQGNPRPISRPPMEQRGVVVDAIVAIVGTAVGNQVPKIGGKGK